MFSSPLSRPVSRRGVLAAGAAAPAAVLLAGCGQDQPQPAGAPDEVTYATGFGVFGREGYAHVAEAKGFFAQQNLQVRIEPGAPSSNTTALLEGEIQFTSVDATGLMIRHGLGNENDTVIISAVQQQPTMSLISLNIDSPHGLEGATIGAVPGGITETLFPTYANLAGFDPSSVTFEHMDVAQLTNALVAGRVDAIALFVMSRPAVERAADRPARVLAYSEYLTDLFGAVHITSRQILEDDPDLVRRFNTALLQGLDYSVRNPGEAGELLAGYVPEVDPQVAAAELEAMAPYVGATPGEIDEAKAGRGLAFIEGIDQIPITSDLAELREQIFAFDVIPGGGGQ